MNLAVIAPAIRGSHLRLIGALLALASVLLWFVAQKLHYFSDFSLHSYSDYYWPRRTGLILHLTGGSLAISAGLVQIWLGLTNRVGIAHRTLGKVYGAGVLIGSLGGFYLALTVPGHLPYSAGLFTLCIAWVVTTGMALYAIHIRCIEQHREWMLRSYTVTFAFVTYRFASTWLERWVHVPDDPHVDDIDTLLAWACWAVPLLFAEVFIQLGRMRRVRHTASGRGGPPLSAGTDNSAA